MPDKKTTFTHISDTATDEDHLDRRRFANSLARLIIDAPDGSSFRVGVYADWGQGKTTILSMMAATLESEGISCVPYVPWLSGTKEEVIDDILSELLRKVDEKAAKRHSATKDSLARAEVMVNVGSNLKEFFGPAKLIFPALEKMVAHNSSKYGAGAAEDLLRKLQEALSERRLVLLVDDADRARVETLPEMLLTIREVLDLPNLYSVLALSPDVIARGLQASHSGWDDPLRFLEKIVEYPFFLPLPEASNIRSLIQQHVSECEFLPEKNTLLDLSSLMPANPRQIKLFLRYLTSMRSLLSRFDANEVNWRAFYLCQMLRSEFPRETAALATDAKAIKNIENYALMEGFRERYPQLGESPELKYTPDDEVGAERYNEIMTALRQSTTIGTDYSIGELLTIVERPPLITWSEFYIMVAALKQLEAQQAANKLSEWIQDKESPVDAASAIFSRIIRYRDRLLGRIADEETQEELLRLVPEVDAADKILIALIDGAAVVRSGLVRPASWIELVEHIGRWDHFRLPKAQCAPLRSSERHLLARSIVGANSVLRDQSHARLSFIVSQKQRVGREYSSALISTARQLVAILEEDGADSVLRRFEESNGIAVFWGERNDGLEKSLLFRIDSPVFKGKRFAKLRRLAARASENDVIHRNFYEFLDMLMYGAISGRSSFPQECVDIVTHSAVMPVIWRAATARALNIRVMGSLRHYREQLITTRGVGPDVMKLPRWWLRYEKMGLWTDATPAGSDDTGSGDAPELQDQNGN